MLHDISSERMVLIKKMAMHGLKLMIKTMHGRSQLGSSSDTFSNISVARDGTVLAVRKNGTICVWFKESGDVSGYWKDTGLGDEWLSVSFGNSNFVTGIKQDGSYYRLVCDIDGIWHSSEAFGSGDPNSNAPYPMQDLSIGYDGTLCGIEKNSPHPYVFSYLGNNTWSNHYQTSLVQLSTCNNQCIWGVDSYYNTYQRSANGTIWRQAFNPTGNKIKLKHVSVTQIGSEGEQDSDTFARNVYGIDTNDKFWYGTVSSNGDNNKCTLTPETISDSNNFSLSWIEVNYCFIDMAIDPQSRYTRDIIKFAEVKTFKLKSKLELGNENNQSYYYVIDYIPGDEPTGNTLAISINDDNWAEYNLEAIDETAPDIVQIYQVIGDERYYWTVEGEDDRVLCSTTQGTIDENSDDDYYKFRVHHEFGIEGYFIESIKNGRYVKMVTSEGVLKANGGYDKDRTGMPYYMIFQLLMSHSCHHPI